MELLRPRTYTSHRSTFCFDLSGVKCKTRSDILTLQRQWETFERVENNDDIVLQKLARGDRQQLFYQFSSRQEATDYTNGQIAHRNRYPWLPPNTFDSVRNKPFPLASTITSTITKEGDNFIVTYTSSIYQVPSKTGIPNIGSQTRITAPFEPTPTSSEYVAKLADLQTFIYVSSYNQEHSYKYIFKDDVEKLAYYRAERQVLGDADAKLRADWRSGKSTIVSYSA